MDFKNPYLENVLYDWSNNETIIDPFYPCIKYKIPADQKLDGTDYFIAAESMHLKWWDADHDFNCSLSITCENDQKAFYKLIKGCLRFRIYVQWFCALRKHSWFSLI